MAEILSSTSAEQITSAQAINMEGILNFFTNPIFLFIFALLIIAIVIIVFIVMKMKKEDSFRERDDINYAVYKRCLRDCLHNADTHWVEKSYSFKNLLLFGIPVFWNEHSLKVTDTNDVLLGYYRGHKLTEQGEKIYCLYKTKRFFILENLFLLRCIDTHSYENVVEEVDTKTKKVKTTTKEIVNVNFENYYEWLPQNANRTHYRWLKIQCDGLSEDVYFTIPNYLRKDEKGKLVCLDLRPEFRKNLKEYTTNEQMWRMVTDLSKNIDESARSNPKIAQNRYMIEKTEEEKRLDGQTPNQNKVL